MDTKKPVERGFMIIINKLQETTVFGRRQKIDFRYETEASKVMVDFKFDALYR